MMDTPCQPALLVSQAVMIALPDKGKHADQCAVWQARALVLLCLWLLVLFQEAGSFLTIVGRRPVHDKKKSRKSNRGCFKQLPSRSASSVEPARTALTPTCQ